MASGIEYLLTQCVRKPQDDLRWSGGYWLLDTESFHNDIIQIPLTESRDFGVALLPPGGRCYRPDPVFDLALAQTEHATAYIEIKVDSKWKASQRARQMARLRHNASDSGFIVLLAEQAKMSRKEVQDITEGLITKISYSDICLALTAIQGNTALAEVAAAYTIGLQQHRDRLMKKHSDSWNPDH